MVSKNNRFINVQFSRNHIFARIKNGSDYVRVEFQSSPALVVYKILSKMHVTIYKYDQT